MPDASAEGGISTYYGYGFWRQAALVRAGSRWFALGGAGWRQGAHRARWGRILVVGAPSDVPGPGWRVSRPSRND
eukprot:4355773-Prymnesium_polylepis.2